MPGKDTAEPLAAPAGRMHLTAATRYPLTTRHRIFKYGDRDDIPNPGDMLIVSVVSEGALTITTETYIRGSEVARFAEAALACAAEYDAERYWLDAPVTRVRATGAA
jgi:hypothetical protein